MKTAQSPMPIPPLNLSGIRPTEFKVLVEVKEISNEKVIKGPDGQSISLKLMTDDLKDREQMAEMEGLLVAVSPLAFSYADWKDKSDIPSVGQRVIFAKFAGANRTGADGKTYRLINDKDIAAILD